MSDDHIYKVVELIGSSEVGTDDATRKAVARASRTLKNLRWFEVLETRGHLEDGDIAHWQVRVRIGFTLEEPNGEAEDD